MKLKIFFMILLIVFIEERSFSNSGRSIEYPNSLLKGYENYLKEGNSVYLSEVVSIERKEGKYFEETQMPITEKISGKLKLVDFIWGNKIKNNFLFFSYTRKLFGAYFKGAYKNPFMQLKMKRGEKYLIIFKKRKEEVKYLKVEKAISTYDINQYRKIFKTMEYFENMPENEDLYKKLIAALCDSKLTALEYEYCLRRILKYRTDRNKKILNALSKLDIETLKADESLSVYAILCGLYVIDTTDTNANSVLDEILIEITKYCSFVKSSSYKELIIDRIIWISDKVQSLSIDARKLIYEAVRGWNSDKIRELKKSLRI